MKQLLSRIERTALRSPRALAVTDGRVTLSYRQLLREVAEAAAAVGGERVGLLADNGCAWAAADLAVARRGAVCVPMPGFFSDGQLAHLVADAGLDTVLADDPARVAAVAGTAPTATVRVAGRDLAVFRPSTAADRSALPPGTAKVTYTSGTTGAPKGVCLSAAALERVTLALCEAVSAQHDDRSVALLPLSTLLENIGGLYAPLWAGGCAHLPALTDCGVTGSSGVDPERMLAALRHHDPSTVILVPQLLKALTEGVALGAPAPRSLRLAAVGGAAVSAGLVERARQYGIPAYEGYGLSEASSVVTLNRPGADRPGTAGRPLPHARLEVEEDGELVVRGELFLGYLGEAAAVGDRWRTGDLGRIDEAGYLHILGRRKTAYATAFGRNVSPEWVESELVAAPEVAQAAVFGDRRPFNAAVLVPVPGATPEGLAAAVRAANARLPDYARVGAWLPATAPFTAAGGLATTSGSVLRDAVGHRYRQEIDHLYQQGKQHAVL